MLFMLARRARLLPVLFFLIGCSSGDARLDAPNALPDGGDPEVVTDAGGGGGDGGDAAATCAHVTPPTPQVHLALAEGSGQVLAAAAPRTIRAIWENTYDIPPAEPAGLVEIGARITRMRAAGINSVSFLLPSNYLAAIIDPTGHGAAVPTAAWDLFGRYMAAVRTVGMEVHVWFAPMILKEAGRANELTDHPEWALKSGTLAVPAAVDLASDAARAYEVELLRVITDRYHPDVIELEEPFYHDVVAGTPLIPTDPPFAQRFQTKFGYPPTTNNATRDADVATLKREVINQFFTDARAAVLGADPTVALHANIATLYAGYSPLASTGFDLPTLRDAGLIDGFVPQLYYPQLADFESNLAGFEASMGGRVSVIAGVTTRFVSASKVSVNASYFNEVARAERGGGTSAAGSSTFAYLYLGDVEAGLDARPVPELTGVLGHTKEAEPSDPTWTAGPTGHLDALQFDGVDDLVTVPGAYALDEYGQLTFASWVRLAPGPRAPHETLMSRGSQSPTNGFVWIYRTADGRLNYQYADGTAFKNVTSDPVAIDDGAWHHVAVIQDRASHEVRFYVDGEARGAASYKGRSVPAVSGDLSLGTYAGSGTVDYALHGALADVRWFRRALTPDEVAAIVCGNR